jgi:hypothetical protein
MLALPDEELPIMKKSFSLKCFLTGPQREQNYINISFHIILKKYFICEVIYG